MLLVPYYFQESNTEGSHKVMKKAEQDAFSNTCFGGCFEAVINAAHARSPGKIEQL